VRHIEAEELVVVHCSSPRQRLWGVLLRLDAVGVMLRGLDINSVEDWLRQEISGSERLIGPSTVFIPSHRIEQISLDEASGGAPGIGDRLAAACGANARDLLLETE
jgi:hypothetical protein